ncbi:MAG: hypothetical protein ACRECO_01125 [Xanthobacteraceae bacterium]
MTKAAALPEAAQEQLGREMLERIEPLNELWEAIQVGIRQLDAGEARSSTWMHSWDQLHREDAGRK